MSSQGSYSTAIAFSLLIVLTGCGSISDLTKERVARSEVAVQQAQQTLGNSEAGAVELQRARESIKDAQQAVKDNDEEKAERKAQQAQLDADLAVAKSQSAAAGNAAAELKASTKALRDEAARN